MTLYPPLPKTVEYVFGFCILRNVAASNALFTAPLHLSDGLNSTMRMKLSRGIVFRQKAPVFHGISNIEVIFVFGIDGVASAAEERSSWAPAVVK